MNDKVDVLAVLARRVAESRARSYAYRVSAAAVAADEMEAARAAVADLIEECDSLAMTPHGHVDSVLQARIAAVSAALARVKGE